MILLKLLRKAIRLIGAEIDHVDLSLDERERLEAWQEQHQRSEELARLIAQTNLRGRLEQRKHRFAGDVNGRPT